MGARLTNRERGEFIHISVASEGTCVIKPEFVPFFSVNVVYIMQLSENCSQSVKITNNCQE